MVLGDNDGGSGKFSKLLTYRLASECDVFLTNFRPDARRRLKIEPGAKLMVVEFNGGLRLMPLKPPAALRGIARGLCTTIEREPDRPL